MTKTCAEQFLEDTRAEALRKFYNLNEKFLHSVRAVIEAPDPEDYKMAKWSLTQWLDGAKHLLEVHAARVGLLSQVNDIRLGKYKLVDAETGEAKELMFADATEEE